MAASGYLAKYIIVDQGAEDRAKRGAKWNATLDRTQFGEAPCYVIYYPKAMSEELKDMFVSCAGIELLYIKLDDYKRVLMYERVIDRRSATPWAIEVIGKNDASEKTFYAFMQGTHLIYRNR